MRTSPSPTAISGVILVSAAITANGALLAGPRAIFAASRDGLFPGWLQTVHPRFGTPSRAVVATGCWAVFLIVASVLMMETKPADALPGMVREAWLTLQKRPLFDVLIAWVMFAYLFLQALMPVALIVLRRKDPARPRPYRVPWYPVIPIASCVSVSFLMFSIAKASPLEALAGVGLMLTGLGLRAVTRSRYDQ